MARLSLIATVIFVVDQISKYWVVHAMDLKTVGAIDVLPPFLNFRMAWNQGINFGILNMGDNGRWVLITVSLILVAFVIVWARRSERAIVHIGAGIVVGGALGNVIDRFLYGAVADFLNMSCCGINNPFAFNVADIAIFAGAGLLIFFGEEKKAAE